MTTAAYAPKGILESMEAMTEPTTANGHKRIARPANGTHAVSKKGPSRPIRSWTNRFHPLKSIIGLLQSAIRENIIPSTTIPNTPTTKAPGRESNLQGSDKNWILNLIEKDGAAPDLKWTESKIMQKYFISSPPKKICSYHSAGENYNFINNLNAKEKLHQHTFTNIIPLKSFWKSLESLS